MGKYLTPKMEVYNKLYEKANANIIIDDPMEIINILKISLSGVFLKG